MSPATPTPKLRIKWLLKIIGWIDGLFLFICFFYSCWLGVVVSVHRQMFATIPKILIGSYLKSEISNLQQQPQ